MMKDPSFITGSAPAGYELDFDPFLYNCPDHLSLQSGTERRDFFMVDHKRKSITGRSSFFIRETFAYNPLNAPFGSFQFSRKTCLETIFRFTAFACDYLQTKGIKNIIIKNYPAVYAPDHSAKLATALYEQGFSVQPVINHHLIIEEYPFEKKIHPMERRKLKKCISAGYHFTEEPLDALKDIYTFISQCRQKKGQPINIEFEQLEKSMRVLSGKYRIFSLRDKGLIIAATVIVSVNKNISYNFLPASLPEYNHHSPMIYLLSEIYRYCRLMGIKILDLGISATEDQQQFSLMRFKSHLGAETSLKFTFNRSC